MNGQWLTGSLSWDLDACKFFFTANISFGMPFFDEFSQTTIKSVKPLLGRGIYSQL